MNHFQINKKNKKIDRIVEEFQKKILNISIQETFSELKILKRKYNKLFTTIKIQIGNNEFELFIKSHKLKQERIFNNTKEVNRKKLEHLIKEKNEKEKFELLKIYNPNYFQNLSSIAIPENAKIILSLGPNFGLKYERKNLPIMHTISSIETGIRNSEHADEIRINACHEITKFLHKYKSTERTHQNSFLKKYIDETKTFLKSNPGIIITKADKSNCTIVMDKTEYENKIQELLNDTQTYKIIPRNPINKVHTNLNKIISNLHNNNIIEFKTSKYL